MFCLRDMYIFVFSTIKKKKIIIIIIIIIKQRITYDVPPEITEQHF